MTVINPVEIQSLPEDQVKARFREVGIPATEQHLFTDIEDLERLVASQPEDRRWVLKVSVDGLTHKSAVGGVHVDVLTTDLVESFTQLHALGQQVQAQEGDYRGVLVEEYVGTGAEVAVGFHRDSHLGPIVMVGEGGTNIEDARNVRFAGAPVSHEQAQELVARWASGSRVGKTLDTDRRAEIVEIVVRVAGENGLAIEEADSLDINPILVLEDRVVAVDGVLVPTGEEFIGSPAATDLTDLKEFLDPKSLAVVGASTDPLKAGNVLFRNLVEFGYTGRLYAVHPTADEIYGVPAFSTLAEIGEPVDKVIVLVSRDRVLDTVKQCVELNIPAVHIYSAGFAEQHSGTPGETSTRELEEAILQAIAGTRTRVMGPNCWGAYSPRSRITSTAARFASPESGGVAFLSQSGTHYLDVVRRSNERNLPLYGALSLGNCLDVGVAETAKYLLEQSEVTVLGAYVEGTEDTRQLADLIQASDKPVVVMRGGRTDAGERAAASHTAALAADDSAWLDLITEAGGIVVDTIEEMLDTLTALDTFGYIDGPRLTMYGPGGGVGVTGADFAARTGLVLPVFDTDLTEELQDRYGSPGTSMANPVDVTVFDIFPNNQCVLSGVLSLIGHPDVSDSVIAHLELGSMLDTNPRERVDELVDLLIDDLTGTRPMVPTSLVARTGGLHECSSLLDRLQKRLHPVGIPVYETIQDAVTTHARIVKPHRV